MEQEDLFTFYLSKSELKVKESEVNCKYYNPACGDQGGFKIEINNSEIISLKYSAVGCVLSKVSAALACSELLHIKLANVKEIYNNFQKHILDFEDSDYPENWQMFKDLYKYPARSKCVLLPWQCLLEHLNKLKLI